MLIRRLVLRVLKIAGYFAAVVLAVFLGCLLANHFDDELTPAAKAILVPDPNPYRPEENIYLAVAGFGAPSQQPVVQAGLAKIDAYNRALDSMLLDPDVASAVAKSSTPNALLYMGDPKEFQRLTSSIWTTAKTQRDRIGAALAANRELYDRFRALHAMKGYVETARPSYLGPVIVVPQAVHALFLADAAVRIQSGDPARRREALDDLEQDLRLWRTIVTGKGCLIGKMIAIAGLHSDVLLLGDMLADSGSTPPLTDAESDALLTPFPVDDWKIGQAFVVETRAMAAVLGTVPLANSPIVGSSARPNSFWERQYNVLFVQFFKLHATENLEAEHLEHVLHLAAADPAKFSQALGDYDYWANQRPTIFRVGALYNPVGRILVQIADSRYEQYMMRAYDVAALQRLVYLCDRIRRQKISSADVARFMEDHREWATHPIDEKPLSWDPATGTLAVQTVGKRPPERRFSLTPAWLQPPGTPRT